MSHIRWPEGVEFKRVDVIPDERECEYCGGFLYVRDSRHRYLHSFNGPLDLMVRVLHCCNPSCPGSKVGVGAEAEMAVAPPYWCIDWDLFAWMGHRRFKRHWSVPQIAGELEDGWNIVLSVDLVEDYLRKYQRMVAARDGDLDRLASEYKDESDVILTIDGLQPEKGHETLYVVRELRRKRVWFAKPLLSSSKSEVHQLFEHAKQMAERIGKPVRCWMSDKQDAFVSGVREVFGGIPHRYCANHFLRDLAKPVLEADSHAKVQMRRKVRGLRSIEKRLLAELQEEVSGNTDKATNDTDPVSQDARRRQVALDYCSVVRGVLNDDQGGPLKPPGLRMAGALKQVGESIKRSLVGKKGGLPIGH